MLFDSRTLLDVQSYSAFNNDVLPHHIIVESWFRLPSALYTNASNRSSVGFFETASNVRTWVDKAEPPQPPGGDFSRFCFFLYEVVRIIITLNLSLIVSQELIIILISFTGGDVTKENQWSHRRARLALVQLNASHQNSPDAELMAMLEGWIAKAANDSADLLLLPECVRMFVWLLLSLPECVRVFVWKLLSLPECVRMIVRLLLISLVQQRAPDTSGHGHA